MRKMSFRTSLMIYYTILALAVLLLITGAFASSSSISLTVLGILLFPTDIILYVALAKLGIINF